MSIIQEALRELNKQRQRTIKESKNSQKKTTVVESVEETKDLTNDASCVDCDKTEEVKESVEDEQPEAEESETELTEDANLLLVDQDGDVEDPNFDLTSTYDESLKKDDLTEALTKEDVKQADERFKNISDSLINKLIKFAKQDILDPKAKLDAKAFIDWIDDACDGGTLTPIAIEFGPELSAVDVWELVDGDEKFANTITTLAKKINYIDKEGFDVEGTGKKPTTKELTLELIRNTPQNEKDLDDLYNILNKAYYNDDYSEVNEIFGIEESLTEDIQSSLPVQPLPENEVVNYINDIPVARGIEKAEDGTIIAKARPTVFFKLGYFKELADIASKYRGGRGSTPEDPRVRIFKAVEYNKLYTGADYENLGAVKQFRKETGIERSGEKTGFSYQGEGTTVNKIGQYPNGDKALQAYLANNCATKAKYFISLNDEDLKEATKEEVAQYLTPAKARDLLNPVARPKTKEVSTDAESGEEIVVFNPQNVNRLKIKNIYMIGNLGHSLF